MSTPSQRLLARRSSRSSTQPQGTGAPYDALFGASEIKDLAQRPLQRRVFVVGSACRTEADESIWADEKRTSRLHAIALEKISNRFVNRMEIGTQGPHVDRDAQIALDPACAARPAG